MFVWKSCEAFSSSSLFPPVRREMKGPISGRGSMPEFATHLTTQEVIEIWGSPNMNSPAGCTAQTLARYTPWPTNADPPL
mmetsp:Transcript_33550/g.49714  ORF Transcript_33550/g.49714 Transcript_33550/m.49714 type:complete len:80 (-) Transcript_33550:810-1049(-)